MNVDHLLEKTIHELFPVGDRAANNSRLQKSTCENALSVLADVLPILAEDLCAYVQKDPSLEGQPAFALVPHSPFIATLCYRIAHALWSDAKSNEHTRGAMAISHFARSLTGAEIHPAATIVKRLLCQRYGARLVGEDALRLGKSPKEVIAQMRAEDPGKWVFTDQFANQANLKAHLTETGPDFSDQIERILTPGQRLILVKGAGTGASFTGIATSLRANFSTLSTHLVMPEGCDLATDRFVDHPLEGFAVGVVPPFLDVSLVENTQTVSPSEARFGQSEMAKDIGFFPGMTSGANYAAAKRIARANPDALVATLAYDSGESYLASALLAATEAQNQGERQIA